MVLFDFGEEVIGVFGGEIRGEQAGVANTASLGGTNPDTPLESEQDAQKRQTMTDQESHANCAFSSGPCKRIPTVTLFSSIAKRKARVGHLVLIYSPRSRVVSRGVSSLSCPDIFVNFPFVKRCDNEYEKYFLSVVFRQVQ